MNTKNTLVTFVSSWWAYFQCTLQRITFFKWYIRRRGNHGDQFGCKTPTRRTKQFSGLDRPVPNLQYLQPRRKMAFRLGPDYLPIYRNVHSNDCRHYPDREPLHWREHRRLSWHRHLDIHDGLGHGGCLYLLSQAQVPGHVAKVDLADCPARDQFDSLLVFAAQVRPIHKPSSYLSIWHICSLALLASLTNRLAEFLIGGFPGCVEVVYPDRI